MLSGIIISHTPPNGVLPPNHLVSFPCHPALAPFDPIPLPHLAHHSRWLPAHDAEARNHHASRHHGVVQHNDIILQYRHRPNDRVLAYVHVVPHACGLDDGVLTYEDVLADLQREERMHTPVQPRRRP